MLLHQSLKRNVITVVELDIYLQLVTSETKNVETVTQLVTLLKYANLKNLLSNKFHRDITAAGHVSNLNNSHPLNKLQ